MTQERAINQYPDGILSRRTFIKAAAATANALTLTQSALAQSRDYGPDAPPSPYPEPDVIVLNPERFTAKIGNTPIMRLHTGMLWAEGPAWNSVVAIWSGATFPTMCRCAG